MWIQSNLRKIKFEISIKNEDGVSLGTKNFYKLELLLISAYLAEVWLTFLHFLLFSQF